MVRAKRVVKKVDGSEIQVDSYGASKLQFYSDDDLSGCKNHFLKIANDLCYSDKVKTAINNAESVREVESIMVEARYAKY